MTLRRFVTLFFTLCLLSGTMMKAQPAASPVPSDMKIFLLIGQSNMAGRGPVEAQDKVPHPRVFALTKELTWVPAVDPLHFDKPDIAGVGLGSSFGRAVAEAEPKAVIGLVPAAFGGTSLDQWAPGEKLYLDALARARVALKNGKLAGILWHQGEADSAADKAASYVERFGRMIAQLRKDLDAPDIPVIVGETGRFRPNASAINAALAAIPQHVPRSAFVSAAELVDKGDKLHFDSASLREFGRRYYSAWLGLAMAGTKPAGAAKGPGPVVIFKLDDLRDYEGARQGFERVFQLVSERGIVASFGVIADSCEDNGRRQPYYDLIKKWATSGRIEIWHHGYTHKEGEFTGASYEAQYEHLRKSCDLLKAKCGVELRSFGAPYNANDATTVQAMNAVPQLSVWMYPKAGPEAKQVLLGKRVNMEPKTGVVSYDLFVAQFTAHAHDAYMVVQGHPPQWNEASHADFAKIVAFCQEKSCSFSLPYDYAQVLKTGSE